MTIALRNYQHDAITETRHALRKYRNVLLQAPTGAGKTVLASFMADSAANKLGRVYFICHRRELVDQTAATFDECGIRYGYIAAGYPYNPHLPVQICSIDTLKNRLNKVPVPTFCIWDEAHHLGAAGWARVHQHYSRAYHVGLSATPCRLDGKGLDDRFDALIPGPQVEWLIEQGYLAKYKLFSVPGVDLAGIHTRMGDYVKGEAEQAMDTSTITGNIVMHWKRYALDRVTIAFGVTRKHSEHIAAQFRAAGVMAVHLDGETKKQDRRDALRALARGDIKVVSNVGLFGEGYDLATNSGMDVTVGCVVDAAPTKSLGAWLQRCGRSLRPQTRPAVILDHSGNALRHGMPCEPREWTLAGRDQSSRASGQPTLSVRQCPQCFAVHRPAPQCPECSYVYPINGRVLDEVDGELQELDPAEMRRVRAKEQGRAQSLDALIDLGRQRGYKNPEKWAGHVWTSRQAKRGRYAGHR